MADMSSGQNSKKKWIRTLCSHSSISMRVEVCSDIAEAFDSSINRLGHIFLCMVIWDHVCNIFPSSPVLFEKHVISSLQIDGDFSDTNLEFEIMSITSLKEL